MSLDFKLSLPLLHGLPFPDPQAETSSADEASWTLGRAEESPFTQSFQVILPRQLGKCHQDSINTHLKAAGKRTEHWRWGGGVRGPRIPNPLLTLSQA